MTERPDRSPPYGPRLLPVILGAVIVTSIVGTICSVVPSMEFRSESGTVRYEYGLSVLVAPALFAAILILAARALRPSRKRLLAAGSTTIGAFPFLLGIRLVREPGFDLDDEIVTLAPWAIHTYVVCTAVLLAAGILLAVYADALDPDREADFAVARVRRP